jgi:hypothetical protein
VGAGGAASLLAKGASIPALFGMSAIANFAVLAALCAAAPVFLVRCGAWLRHVR